MVRVRRTDAAGQIDSAGRLLSLDEPCEERFVVGVDERRGSFLLPVPVRPGDEVAFALPDPGLARSALRAGIEAIARSECLLHLGCRTRDVSLHGDEDLEAALVAHLGRDRGVLGTVGPFQIGPDAQGQPRLFVHATVLAAV